MTQHNILVAHNPFLSARIIVPLVFDFAPFRSDTSSVDSLQHLLAKAELLERELSSGAYDARARALYANQVRMLCCLCICVQSLTLIMVQAL